MNLYSNLFRIGTFDLRLHHLIIVGVLVLSFSISFLIRSQGANFGFELNEFDPFFNYRATEFIVNNGISEYFDWHDDKSWYPNGRDISASSQVMLHITAAITYQIFGGNSNLYDFTILFPVVIGSLTVVIVFALVRLFAGTLGGLIASLLFSVSLPIIIRGTIGWFKSEPLGIFYGLLAMYLFLSGINSKNKKIALLKVVFGAIILSFGLASWGGIQFIIIPLGLFLLALPFVRKDHEFLIWSIPLFVTTFLITTSMFERPGLDFVFGLGGFSLIVPTAFMTGCMLLQKISKEENKTRNGLILLASIILIGTVALIINVDSNFLDLPSFRYLNAVNPFLTTTNPLVDSVSEHANTTISHSFFFHSVLMIFAGIGVWLILSKTKVEYVNNDMKVFALILGITGVYVSSAFVRLELFASISLIVLSSMALSIISKEILKENSIGKLRLSSKITKITFVIVMIMVFLISITYPPNGNWITIANIPPTILNGGTSFQITSNDWLETLDWIKTNTPNDAVVASWWDYGYWITTMSDRATLADNATIDSKRIQNIAKILLSQPDDAWYMLNDLGATHVVIFVSGEKLGAEHEENPLYILGGGGDESKKQWFIRIAEEPTSKYLYSDGFSGTEYFWNETLLGNMIPFSTIVYHNLQNQQQSETFRPGFTPIYIKNIKYNSDDSPLKLVYASSSFTDEKIGPMIGVFVYEINQNYIPKNLE